DKISGFEWEEGFEYELIVADKELENPPADGSTLRYELVEVVSKTAVAVSPSISFLDAKWSLGELSIDGATIRMPEDSTAYLIIEGDNVSGTTGCNNFMGTATFNNGSVTFAPLAVTRKMCIDDALMAFETSLLGLFENATTFSAGRDTLELGNADGTMTTLFTRVAEQTLYVGPEQADCVGVGPQKCLLVKDNPEDEYTFFYSNIAGFEWEAGSEYELRVEIIQILNPPADASSLRYELVEIVSQVEVSGEQ
ncbi:MAG: DUF4377 domain-containing protein, partial [Methylococcales bacterium]|nr:DUF4377 domain-containing protein [Methylococcales bacterium]